MQYLLRRLIERQIVARRADADFIRRAITDAYDITGRVRAVQGDTITDPEQHFAANVYGRFTGDGAATPGEQLVMLDGAAEGQAWELLSTIGNELQVAEDADLVAAGVAVGDHYEIRRAQEDRAIDWFSKAALRVIIGYPSDPASAPCYSVNFEATTEQSRPVGNVGRRLPRAEAAEPTNELRSRWGERYTVQCVAITPDAVDWMARVLLYVYRTGIRLFDRHFEGDTRAEFGALRRIDEFGCFVREFSVHGTVDHMNLEVLDSFVDESAQAVPNPRRVV